MIIEELITYYSFNALPIASPYYLCIFEALFFRLLKRGCMACDLLRFYVSMIHWCRCTHSHCYKQLICNNVGPVHYYYIWFINHSQRITIFDSSMDSTRTIYVGSMRSCNNIIIRHAEHMKTINSHDNQQKNRMTTTKEISN